MAPAAGAIFPISELSSYATKWTIRARVTSKSQLRTFTKGSGSGKVFSVDLLDAEGGEIRATFFNEAVDAYLERMEKGKVYTFSQGSIRISNRQFNSCNHRYEIVFDKSAQVDEVQDDTQIEKVKFSLVDLRTVQTRPLPSTFDLCGIIVDFRPTFSFTSQGGRELVKREMTIADDTSTSLQVVLWGSRAQQDDATFEGNPVVCLKGVSVKEWNGGRNGSLMESGEALFRPDMDEAKRLKQWWEDGGKTQSLTALSQQFGGSAARAANAKAATVGEMRKALEQVTGPETFSIVCRLTTVMMKKQGEQLPLHYVACQEPKEGKGFPCNRRLDESGFCAACNRAGKAAPRFNIRALFADFSDKAWLTTFHEGAEKLLGMAADEARSVEQADGREAIEALLRKQYLQRPFQVSVRAKPDSFNGEPRTNTSCIDARPVSHGEHGRAMLKEISAMLAA